MRTSPRNMPPKGWRATLTFLVAACLLPLLPACNDGVSTVHAERVVYRASPAAPQQAVNVTIPARTTLSLQEGQNRPHLELLDIHRPLGATPIDVTFRLSTGTITLRIPVLPLSRGAGSSTPTASPS
ncbi:hypothetical protein ABZ917_26230 [Nonomuraea wenchangensis]